MMGMWAFNPWDNDEAAGWFGDLMDSTQIRREWLKGISTDPMSSPDTVRAAGALFVMLGRVYVWPIKTFDEDLEKAIAALTRLKENDDYAEVPELIQHIENELAELRSRRKPEKGEATPAQSPQVKPWWAFWK